jgi:hypothetical protein
VGGGWVARCRVALLLAAAYLIMRVIAALTMRV